MFYCNTNSDNTSGSEDVHDDNDNSDFTFEENRLSDFEKLKIMREKVNWENEKERQQFFLRLYRLVKDKKDLYVFNLRDIFRPEEIEWLLMRDIRKKKRRSDKKYSVIEFVIRSRYKDEPEIDEDGKPILRRTTALHYAAGGDLCDHELVRQLFKIYCKFNFNYTDEYGFTHFHAACKFDCCGVVAQFLVLGQDPNCFPEEPNTSRVESPLHFAAKCGRVQVIELLLKSGADPKLANEAGLTPLHVISKTGYNIESANMLFKISDEKHTPIDINARDGSGWTPLHYALEREDRLTAEYLVKSGADLNIADDAGLTPLHIICKTSYGDGMLEDFLKICDDNHLQVQVDVLDNKGRTPLQWAVASFLPESVNLLLDRGADLSSFVFPTEDYYADIFVHQEIYNFDKLAMEIASDALAIVEHLEKRGYKLNLAGALTIMGTFAAYGIFSSRSLDTSWSDSQEFENKAKTIIVKDNDPKLSLYDLIQLQPEEAEKLLTYADYSKLADSNGRWYIPDRHICAVHLCEMITRGFCRRWALESFMEVTRNKFPISWCEKIIDSMMNNDLYFICLNASE
ncbi:tankyrase-1-like [Trichogramma pretiosum]|uniref:tankyrase-1-like n=1 Tax=Trichogramma pretiosum TaxID=7493 RepID=UPI000C7189AA|nr:tankyrase-1-like [Trichogramma pretiosum]